MVAATRKPVSRHDRFRAILEAAAGQATADYGGYGRFWNLPLPELRRFTLYGMAMMGPSSEAGEAPAPEAGSCCGRAAAAPTGGSAPGTPGLILGLRGLPPFDGTQFPALPWGGTRVAETDVAFIAQWIADGCPAADEHVGLTERRHAETRRLALATGELPHPAFDGPANAIAAETGAVKVRKNVDCLSADLSRFPRSQERIGALRGLSLRGRNAP